MGRADRGRRGGRAPAPVIEVDIDNLSHEGRGVGRHEGKTVFVDGALPGERVSARVLKSRGRFDEAETVTVLTAADTRATPPCAHYGVCGGCSLQHASEALQLEHKQSVLLELLRHQGGLQARTVNPPLQSPQWGYRRKARLGVKLVPKKGGVIVGFREKSSPYVTDCASCEVLDPRVGHALPALRALVAATSIPDRVPQIEVAIGDEDVVLVFRHLEPFTDADRAVLASFAREHGMLVLTQAGGLDTVMTLDGGPPPLLGYTVQGERIEFLPTDFTQVNAHINAGMVAGALERLALTRDDEVFDLFCGVGNFTLPIARRAGRVTGIEGDAGLTRRAAANAARNGLENVAFEALDLADPAALARLDLGRASKLLLDPPRAGALALLESVNLARCERLVYVSCSPVTFARDAQVLVERHGFTLVETGILDMFPHTAHVESLSLFVRE